MSQAKQAGDSAGRSDNPKQTSVAADAKSPAKAAQAKAGEIKQDLKEDADALRQEAVAQANSFAETHKETVAETVGGVAKAALSAAEELEQRDQSEAARLVRDVAGGLDRFSDTVANNDMSQLFNKTQTFAKRQPAAFLGGAVLLGLALGRFAKSTSARDDDESRGSRVRSGREPIRAGALGGTN